MKDKSIQWQMKFWLAKWFGFIFGEIGHEPEEIESDEEWNGLDELIKQKLLQNADVILKYLDGKNVMYMELRREKDQWREDGVEIESETLRPHFERLVEE